MFGNRLIKSNNAGAACTTDTVQILDGTPLESIATYQLDGAATSIPNNTYPGTPTNITYAAGEFGQAAEFNGSSSAINIGTELIPATSNFSLSFWINRNTSSDSDLFNQATSSGDIRTYFKLYSNGTFGVFSAGTNGSRIQVPNTTSAITNGQWEHIAIVRDGSNMTFYINGTGETETISGGTVGVGRGDLIIGSASASPDGKIDQVRIFNSALPQAAVTALYNETVATASNSYINVPSCIAYYKMSDATDQTGSYDGTPSNVNFNVAGKFGNAGGFNGSSSNISLPTSIKPSNSIMSISLWASNNSTARKNIFFLEYTNSNAFLALENNSFTDSTALSVLYNNTAIITPANSALPTDGSWHHIVVTASATEVKLYKNGSQIGSTATVTVNTNALTAAHIGVRDYNNDLYWNGKIDQVRIFNRAITSNEVETLYNEVQCIPTIVPTDNFETVIYDGDGNDNRSITGVGFEPDFIWLKNSNNNWGHTLVDSVRGLNAANVYGALASDQSAAETTTNPFGAIKTLDTDGFTIKDGTDVNGYYAVNRLNSDYVAWCWKAADATTTIAANTIGNTIASDVRANTEAGFSIVKYTKSGTTNTIGHGLNSVPEIILEKRTDGAAYWNGRVEGITANNQTLYLNQSTGVSTHPSLNLWTTPTDSVFGYNSANATAGNYIAYCFHSVDGYSKIGSYVGTGAAGNSIVTGFRPAFIMFKSTSAQNWNILDNKRNPTNPLNLNLRANTSDAESSTGDPAIKVDFNSNGWTIVGSGAGTGQINSIGQTYIFMAFAEEVFVPDNFFNDDSTVATYKLNGDAGDDSGNGYNGTPFNVTYAAGKFDEAGVFNGSSSKILPSLSPIPSSGAFTVSAWVKTSVSNHCFISFGDFWLKSEYLSGVFSLGDINTSFQGTTDISDNVWHHCVVSVDASNNITLYVDGVSEDTGTATINRTNNGSFVIGVARNSNPVYYWNGSIDQVRIFNRALDSGEVTQLYNE